MTYEERYGEYQEAIEAYLDGLFTAQKPYSQLYEAIRYSILGGGKTARRRQALATLRNGLRCILRLVIFVATQSRPDFS